MAKSNESLRRVVTIAPAEQSVGEPSPLRLDVSHLKPLWLVHLSLYWRGIRSTAKVFARNPIGIVGLILIIVFALMALAHPILMSTVWDTATYDPVTGFAADQTVQPAPPSAKHLLGTDLQGRDVLSQLMFSARDEFVLGMTAALVTVILATLIGGVAGYFGGVVDFIFMRIADLIIMMPLITALAFVSGLFRINLIQLAILIGIFSGFGATTVIIKSKALTICVKPFIQAARAAGGGNWYIVRTHVLPNLIPFAFLYMMFTATSAIFSEATLSFLGLLKDIRMSWGIMIQASVFTGGLFSVESAKWLKYWWLTFPAGLSITLLCSAFYLIGRALDEVFNPRLQER